MLTNAYLAEARKTIDKHRQAGRYPTAEAMEILLRECLRAREMEMRIAAQNDALGEDNLRLRETLALYASGQKDSGEAAKKALNEN